MDLKIKLAIEDYVTKDRIWNSFLNPGVSPFHPSFINLDSYMEKMETKEIKTDSILQVWRKQGNYEEWTRVVKMIRDKIQ